MGPPRHLAGRLVLPPGEGVRGVDVELRFLLVSGETATKWAIPDPEGRFGHAIDERPHSVVVTAGVGFDLRALPTEALPQHDSAGLIDLGELDLSDLLERHSLRLEAAPGAALGQVRVGMWSGPPPPSVALGSRQFPSVEVGSVQEWLVPAGAEEIYFLIERPRDPDPTAPWWGGGQQLYGPFDQGSLPAALTLD